MGASRFAKPRHTRSGASHTQTLLGLTVCAKPRALPSLCHACENAILSWNTQGNDHPFLALPRE